MRGLPALSQINLEHARITLYLLHRALAQDRTLVEYRHLGAELADEFHVVLDDQDGAVARDAEEQLGGARGLSVRQARPRLVDEEERGILRHHHPDLQPLLLAVRQRARQHAALGGEADLLQRAVDAAPVVGHVAALEEGREDALAGASQGQLDVLAHGEVHEHGRRLEFPPDPERGDLVLAELRQVRVVAEDHATARGPDASGDHVEQRGLARPVGSDDDPQLAAVHVENEPAERLEAVVVDGDVVEIDDRVRAAGARAHWSGVGEVGSDSTTSRVLGPTDGVDAREGTRRLRVSTRRAAAPTTPSGKKSTTLMKRAPRKRSQTSG